jgi:parallel beta-helix repeat protein
MHRLIFASFLVVAGCQGDDFDRCTDFVEPAADTATNRTNIQTAFGDAKPGSVICFRAGTYALKDELLLTTPGVELRGSAKDPSVLDFAGQERGKNGLNVTGADGFAINHLTVKNTAGDGVRVSKTIGVTLRDLRVRWDTEASTQNGGYGIYPTESTQVVIEGCTVQGASDAGIYVGQSSKVIVRNNEVFGNVAGIEIENTTGAEVDGNHTYNNTGGILVFALPNLPIKQCERILLHHNRIHDNNLPNFAAPGAFVRGVPSGTGMFIMAADNNEIRDNTIENNDSLALGLLGFQIAMTDSYKQDKTYDPFSEGNYIHDNIFKNNGTAPRDMAAVLIAVVKPGNDPAEDLIWDGSTKAGSARNCFARNGAATYRNLDYLNNFQNSTTDAAPVTCDGTVVAPQPSAYEAPQIPAPPTFVPKARLSEYGYFTGSPAAQLPAAGVVPYTVASSLFADGAGKQRFIVLPPGGKIGFSADGPWTFPDGTVLIKTFYFDKDQRNPSLGRRMIETRLEVFSAGTWTMHTYLYDDTQNDAVRHVPGAGVSVSFIDESGASRTIDYRVPSTDQCKSCHLSNRAPVPLGPKTKQWNTGTQLAEMSPLFASAVPDATTLPRLANPSGTDPIEMRARAYLDANCAHCHSEKGAASSTSLRLNVETTALIDLGVCRSPNAAGPGAGNLLWDIVPGKPEESVLLYRMQRTDPAAKMPPLPSTTVDAMGASLISAWIASMPAQTCN